MSTRPNEKRNNRRTRKNKPPVKVTSEGPECTLIAAVPGSVVQALNFARAYEADPGGPMIVTRGEKILYRIESGIANLRKAREEDPA